MLGDINAHARARAHQPTRRTAPPSGCSVRWLSNLPLSVRPWKLLLKRPPRLNGDDAAPAAADDDDDAANGLARPPWLVDGTPAWKLVMRLKGGGWNSPWPLL